MIARAALAAGLLIAPVVVGANEHVRQIQAVIGSNHIAESSRPSLSEYVFVLDLTKVENVCLICDDSLRFICIRKIRSPLGNKGSSTGSKLAQVSGKLFWQPFVISGNFIVNKDDSVPRSQIMCRRVPKVLDLDYKLRFPKKIRNSCVFYMDVCPHLLLSGFFCKFNARLCSRGCEVRTGSGLGCGCRGPLSHDITRPSDASLFLSDSDRTFPQRLSAGPQFIGGSPQGDCGSEEHQGKNSNKKPS